MSEEEYSTTAVLEADMSQQRKGPRFSWTPQYEATFFRSLCDSVQLGLKDNHSFKQEAWERAMQALQERHGAYPNKGHLINKSDNARKKFRLWRGLREDTEFLYNPNTKTVTASEEAWRAHVEREPLSRSLKGRPFEHEEYYEILFPDVIGSGGAPKRITKIRRKGPEGMSVDGIEQDLPGATTLDLLVDNVTYTAPVQAPAPRPSISATSAPAPIVPSQARPTSTAIPPRTSIASTSALTPPDENGPHTRKRFAVPDNTSYPEKRRRTTANNAAVASLTNPVIDLTHGQRVTSPAGAASAAGAVGRVDGGLGILADAIARSAAAPPRWPEQAMEIFFRDFHEEDMDLQVKIAEKMLTDANKAAMFVKMPVVLRQHWIKRLREAHNRIGIGN